VSGPWHDAGGYRSWCARSITVVPALAVLAAGGRALQVCSAPAQPGSLSTAQAALRERGRRSSAWQVRDRTVTGRTVRAAPPRPPRHAPSPRQRDRLSSLFGEAGLRAGKDKTGAGEVVMLALDEVRGEIVGRPRHEESRCLGTETVEQVAEPCSLDGVQEQTGHIARV